MMEIVKQHQRQGHKTMILSGMFGDLLEVVAQKTGIDYVVGTRMELINGSYSRKNNKTALFLVKIKLDYSLNLSG